jgi:mRNA-degrading endonuclease RelE of RelBE toxin-antitoxin system
MTFHIEWNKQARKQLDKLDSASRKNLWKAIDKLRDDQFRIKAGDYRIIFAIEEKTVTIQAIGHRREIYRD